MKFPKLKVESQDFLHLDCLRIIAAAGVMFFHFRSMLGFQLSELKGLTQFVDMFFAMSGVIICHVYGEKIRSPATYGDFLKRRIARLGPLHWATLLFFAGLFLVASRLGAGLRHPEGAEWSCFVPNALFLHAFGMCHADTFNGVSWSLSAEMGAYLLFPAILILLRKSRLAVLVAALAMIGVLFAIAPAWFDWMYNGGVLRAIPGFMLGVAFYSYRVELARWIPSGAVYVLLAAFLVAVWFPVPRAALLVLAYLTVAAGVAADGKPSGGVIHSIAPWGSLTFSVYMLHWPVKVILPVVMAKLHLQGLPAILLAYAAMPAVFGLAYLSLFLFETPARRWITRLQFPRLPRWPRRSRRAGGTGHVPTESPNEA